MNKSQAIIARLIHDGRNGIEVVAGDDLRRELLSELISDGYAERKSSGGEGADVRLTAKGRAALAEIDREEASLQSPNTRITAILDRLTELDNQVEREKKVLLADLATQRGLLEIPCESCKGRHAIKDLVAIQTHWYTRPHGCTGGDYWNVGEMQFICPETGVRNRLLFNNDDVPWEDRRAYSNDPEAQFRRIYTPLFREVREEHEENTPGKWVNNYHADRNRKVFGLVARRAKALVA